MSLKQAVEAIINVMKQDHDELVRVTGCAKIQKHIELLQVAIKASEYEGTSLPKASDHTWIPPKDCEWQSSVTISAPAYKDPHIQIYQPTDADIAQFQPDPESAADPEASMLIAEGGPFDSDYVPIDPGMPIGAHTSIGGVVYTRTKTGLQYNEKITKMGKDGKKSST